MAMLASKELLLQAEGAVAQYMALSESPDALSREEASTLEARVDDLLTRTAQALNA